MEVEMLEDSQQRVVEVGGEPARSVSNDCDVDGNAGAKKGDTWMVPAEHEGLYVKFLRLYYFPIMVRYHSYICMAWLAIFAICIVFGPPFLSSTRSSLDLPPGTPSKVAIDAFQSTYPGASTWPPVFIALHSNVPDIDVIGPFSLGVSQKLQTLAGQHTDSIANVHGYWEYINKPGMQLLALESVSNQTMLITVNFQADASLNAISEAVNTLIDFAVAQNSAQISVGCTGNQALFNEMSRATEANFLLIDGTVVPIAVCILGLSLRSYRHMLVTLCNLACTLMLGFAIMIPVSRSVDINPFAPSIMISTGLAVCFDYNLFFLTRFREERIVMCKSKADAVFGCLSFAGHVVVLSGLTLCAAYLLMLAFPQAFLDSVGWSCGVVVLSAVICCTSITPALLLTFDCLSHFDALPSRASCCCLVPAHDPAEAAAAKRDADAASFSRAGSERFTFRLWFKMAYIVTKYPIAVVLVAVCVTVPFAYQVMNMVPSSDDYLLYVQDSQSLNTLKTMKRSFPEGSLDPYQVMITTGARGGALTEPYFAAESAMIDQLLLTQGAYMNAGSVKALSFYNGVTVNLTTALAYLTPGSAEYASPVAVGYRLQAASNLNGDRSASMVIIETIVPPNSQLDVGFIHGVRDILAGMSSSAPAAAVAGGVAAGFHVQMYLLGAYTTTMDVQDALYKLVPLEIGATVAIVLVIVGLNFGSLGFDLRLAVSVFMSLSWTFGLMVSVYVPGPIQRAFTVISPTLASSSGLYFIVPIMTFSVLVGLALDYDIFLMSRVAEYRRRGWSDRAAMCLAVEKTGGIITTAGLIMSVSFSGLLIPKTIVLNQFGFALFVGVAIDTFVIRTAVVPALFTLFGRADMNWWPVRMPPAALDPAEEDLAMLAGLADPADWAPRKAALSGGDVEAGRPEGAAAAVAGAAFGSGEGGAGRMPAAAELVQLAAAAPSAEAGVRPYSGLSR